MDEATRKLVRERAKNRCEYCRLGQDRQPAFRFHIEHVRPKKHGGTDDESNLALACRYCNLHKASNLSGVDEATNAIVQLFNPRTDNWGEHFVFQGAFIAGQTPVGRATVFVLQMNHPKRLRFRHDHGISGLFE